MRHLPHYLEHKNLASKSFYRITHAIQALQWGDSYFSQASLCDVVNSAYFLWAPSRDAKIYIRSRLSEPGLWFILSLASNQNIPIHSKFGYWSKHIYSFWVRLSTKAHLYNYVILSIRNMCAANGCLRKATFSQCTMGKVDIENPRVIQITR